MAKTPAAAARILATARTEPVPGWGRMNNTERAYALILEADRRAGRVARFDFEPVKLRLADGTFYTPDFRVILPDGAERFDEVKGGYVREDAWVKLKIAAELHPYRFRFCQLKAKRWTFTDLGTVCD